MAPSRPLPPIAAAVSFIDRINHRDLDGLLALMTEDHHLQVLTEAPLRGKQAQGPAWTGYFTSFPNYVIYPRRIAANGSQVAIQGQTTGSHLGLPDDQELKLSVIWIADVRDGQLASWRIVQDAPELRAALGLASRG
jgi:ketosteroid isomerase-like protein